MKFPSLALCLVAAALIVVAEAAPGSVGSHFRARMIRDKALLQRRGDPNSQACEDAKLAGRDKMIALLNSIQDCTDKVSQTKAEAFKEAIFTAYFQKDNTSYLNIKKTYELAIEALESAGENGKSLRAATDAMMAAVDKAASVC